MSSTKSSLLPRVSLMCIGAGEVDDPGPGGGAWVAVAVKGIRAELFEACQGGGLNQIDMARYKGRCVKLIL